ncbi:MULTISPECIES: SDR family oxidoreductase [Prauserella salsuginis group]|uniref:SDR family oxidoreductase n=1 Tax=Prauserella salsuginis TaxID=387889 RepID=A0ABW6G0Q5_9PSEU|nr:MULTISPECIES: SDR family NAD(P)-dependent oxidoreductase [Prauserella salsuginis group]MCR3721936.1 3-oxoacyl-[acyl-carrier protein] reductase [Prauserella flava]MCR3735942.1 3-oxoacyl-[acyl-carrier protein] reductase [Prauserella salsuginis]
MTHGEPATSSAHTGSPVARRQHSGRTYLITGAARGIGRATAEVLLAHGGTVAVADIDRDAITTTARELGALPVVLDTASRESWNDARDLLDREFGGRLSGLVNNAGVTRDKSLSKMDDDMWDVVLDTHLRGTWLGCQTLQPLIAASTTNDEPGEPKSRPTTGRGASGAIVNTSSSGRHGSYGQTNYSAAKAGIVGLTKTIAIEFARFDIRANCVSPGPIDTDMTANVPDEVKTKWLDDMMLGRMGTPHEIGEATAFLLSPAASYITAQVLDVNGGELHP